MPLDASGASAGGLRLALVRGRLRRLLETVQSGALFGIDVEDGIQLCELEQVVHFFCKVQEFKFPTATLDRCVGADKLADTRAIDVVHIGEVEHNVSALVVQKSTDSLAKQGAAFSQGDLAA